MEKIVCTQDAQNAAAFVRLQEYSLADFVAKIQDLVQQGYVFDFKSNESYPVQIGNMFAAGLFKVDEEQIVADSQEQICSEEQSAQKAKADVQAVVEQTEVKPAVRRGRK